MLWLSNNSVHYYEGIRRCLESKPLGWIQIRKQSFWCHDQLSPRLVLTRNSSAQFQPIWTVMWEASMCKHCPVREADTETAFTIFPFPCKSNFLKILTYITPSPSHLQMLHFWGLGNSFGVGGKIALEMKDFCRAKGQGMQVIQENFKCIFFHLFPNTTTWNWMTHLHFFLYWHKTSLPFLFTVTFF